MEAHVKQASSNSELVYGPQANKTFSGALGSFFAEQCPQIGGDLARQALVNAIFKMVTDFFPETSHLRPGQTTWVTMSTDEKSSYGKSIAQSRLVSVVIDIIAKDDALERQNGKKVIDMRQDACARICKQVYEQGGCITLAELSLILKTTQDTISRYIYAWEKEHNEILPRRGTIHDMGPTLTHKKIIIESLFIDRKSVQQTSRETFHSYDAIQRYIGTFKKVLLCFRKKLSKEEISAATGHTPKLIQQYLDLIDEFQTRGINIEQIENYDATIEPHYNTNPPNQS